ncbi:MAG: substrate-binding domain-containing protein [Gracilibacteraceae bacterium]|jgi:ABC-type sugar transport system substrate-binding protein|nr:substrate-binding domain-containing protein [Gracilibacteraceae bacterium]
MKKLVLPLSILVALALSLALAACQNADDTAKTEPTTLPDTVALLLPYAEKDAEAQNEPQKNLLSAFGTYAQQYGLSVSYHYISGDDQTAWSEQSLAISEAAAGEIGVIVVIPVSGADLSAGLADADQAGIPVIALHENIADADTLSAFVGPDYEKAIDGFIETAQNDHAGQSLVFLNGPEGDAAANAFAGYARDVTVIPCDWTAQGAAAAVTELLKTDAHLGAIITANASMARGAEAALKTASLTETVGLYALNLSGFSLPVTSAVPDTGGEALKAVNICTQLIEGTTPELNNLIPLLTREKTG